MTRLAGDGRVAAMGLHRWRKRIDAPVLALGAAFVFVVLLLVGAGDAQEAPPPPSPPSFPTAPPTTPAPTVKPTVVSRAPSTTAATTTTTESTTTTSSTTTTTLPPVTSAVALPPQVQKVQSIPAWLVVLLAASVAVNLAVLGAFLNSRFRT
ncbi:MAG TPA: hypothetical protein VFJ85_06410 [Acidimicrobiales bacterium]|nr:hypothetical protein [Acidimicrobiales bacterium]